MLERSGERSVKVAEEVRRWKVASSMKCGPFFFFGSSSSSGGEEGGGSEEPRRGVGKVMGNCERARPRAGRAGMVAL